jgi:hypothetical protein
MSELDAFLGRTGGVVQHKPKVPESGNDRFDARSHRNRDVAGLAAFGQEEKQVEI